MPKLATIMDDAEPDVLAYMTFPKEHRAKLHSTDDIDKRDFGSPVRFFVRLQVSCFFAPAYRISRASVSRRSQGWPVRLAPRPAARFPGHALTASSRAPFWSGPRRRSCRHISLCYICPARTTTWQRVVREDESAATQPL